MSIEDRILRILIGASIAAVASALGAIWLESEKLGYTAVVFVVITIVVGIIHGVLNGWMAN